VSTLLSVGTRRLRRWLAGRMPAARLLGLRDRVRADLLWHAQRALADDRPDDARRLYELVMALWEREPLAWLGAGVCAEREGSLDVAENLFAHALELDPESAHALTGRASCRLRRGRIGEARDDLLKAQSLVARAGGPAALRERIDSLLGADPIAADA
jgi:tetratricopeptide (TPR) repeat protein